MNCLYSNNQCTCGYTQCKNIKKCLECAKECTKEKEGKRILYGCEHCNNNI